MAFKFPRRLVLLFIVFLSLYLLGCGSTMAPPAASLAETSLPTVIGLQTPEASPRPTGRPAILEARRLTLEWPPAIRTGDSDVVRLTLEVDAAGNLTPTAEIGGHVVTGDVIEFPNLYETHTVMAEARLDMAGVRVDPQGKVGQSLLPENSVTFYWSVIPERVGNYRGTVWLFLRFIPLDGGPASERTLYSKVIDIKAVNLLGLGGTPARLLGLAGTFLGSLLSLDEAISFIWKRLLKKQRE